MPKIILASRSAGRKKVLESLGIDFIVMPSDIDERKVTARSPFELVQKLAEKKAEKVESRIKNYESREKKQKNNKQESHNSCFIIHDSYLIIAADSLAIIEETKILDTKILRKIDQYRLGKYYLLGKPQTIKEARLFLSILSGKTHYFITGLFVKKVKGNVIYQSITKTELVFNKISQEEIDNYVKTQPVLTFAGAYQIEKGTPGEKFVKKLIGSYTNVLGLPKENLLKVLNKSE